MTETYAYAGTGDTIRRIDDGVSVRTSLVDGAGARLSLTTGTTTRWTLFDALGSLVGLIDPDGSLAETYRTDGYGQAMRGTDQTPVTDGARNPFRFRGAHNIGTDAEPLYTMGARAYAPSAGAWTSMDTVAGSAADPAGMNRFLYVEGNPSSLVDPTGHMARDGQVCDRRYDDCTGTRITGAATENRIKGKANRNATYCTNCAASSGGDSHLYQAPDPTAPDQQPTMTDWQVWWRQASPEERRKAQGVLFGREFADETNPEAPPDIECLGRDNGNSQMCRSIQLVSTLIHSADSAFIIAGAMGMTASGDGAGNGAIDTARHSLWDTEAPTSAADAGTATTESTPGGSAVNQVGGRQNCTSCVIAGDSTLAGHPASAVKLSPDVPFKNGMASIQDYAGSTWRWSNGQSAIEHELLAAGDGARGIVYGLRADGTAHVWNAIVQQGRVNFVDFQVGKGASFDGYARTAFIRTR